MVLFLDSTLREGALFEQFPLRTNLEIIRLVADAGSDILELPLPYRNGSAETREIIIRAKQTMPDGIVIMHCRAHGPDLEQVKNFEIDGCAAYLAASYSHRKHKLHGLTKEATEKKLLETADILKGEGWRYNRITIEDASNLYLEDRDYLFHLVSHLARKRVTVGIPDTRGVLFPKQTEAFVRDMMKTGAKLAGHNHDDFGFANYNTAIQAKGGFCEVHTSLMGIGERNGIADIFPTAMLLETLGASTNIRIDNADKIYREFSGFTGITLFFKHPLSESARSLSAGSHQSYPEGYFPESKIGRVGVKLRVSPNWGSKLLSTILRDSGSPLETAIVKDLTNYMASKALELGNDLTSYQIAEIVQVKTGIKLDPSKICNYVGQDEICILVRMKQHSSNMEVRDWAIRSGAYRVNMLYGSFYDLVIFAPNYLNGKAFVDLLKDRYTDGIEKIETGITNRR